MSVGFETQSGRFLSLKIFAVLLRQTDATQQPTAEARLSLVLTATTALLFLIMTAQSYVFTSLLRIKLIGAVLSTITIARCRSEEYSCVPKLATVALAAITTLSVPLSTHSPFLSSLTHFLIKPDSVFLQHCLSLTLVVDIPALSY